MGKVFHAKRRLTGIPSCGSVCRVTRNPFSLRGGSAVSASFALGRGLNLGCVPGFHSGDIVKIHPDGRIFRLWDATSFHNCLFVTEACNFRCVMCPQPPSTDSSEHHFDNLRLLELLDPQHATMIGVTGGEPILFPERLVEYFGIINRRFPSARVEVLTNGSLLSDFAVAKELALSAPLDTCFCVSIHGDTAELAESIMHCRGGWSRALHGMLNLARLHQQIEIRLVLTQKNIPYLRDIALFFYRNFPFVSHIALMGQEIVGDAQKNYSETWIEPISYAKPLADAAVYLDAMGVAVSIYNVPLCLLPERCWRFAEKSISDWKQCYRSECAKCAKMKECCGFFSTSGNHIPSGINPVVA